MVKLAVPGVEQAVCATGCELMDGVVFTVSATLVEVAAAQGSSTTYDAVVTGSSGHRIGSREC